MEYHLPTTGEKHVLRDTRLSLAAKGAWCILRFLGASHLPNEVIDELVSTQHLIVKQEGDDDG